MDKTKATRLGRLEGATSSLPNHSKSLPDNGFRQRTHKSREWQWLMSLERSKYANAQVALLQ